MKPSTPAITRRIPVTISKASHVETVVASAAAIVANANQSMKTAKSAAPTRRPMPTPSTAAFRFSSERASSISSRTIELTRSLTARAAPPRPRSPLWVGMASPIQPLRERDARDERDADHDERIRAAALRSTLRLRPLAELRPGRSLAHLSRLFVRGSLPLRAFLDQLRLELRQECCILREQVRKLVLHAALAGELLRLRAQLVRCRIERAHRLAGGSSPVASRQTEDATRRAPIVAAAPSPA